MRRQITASICRKSIISHFRLCATAASAPHEEGKDGSSSKEGPSSWNRWLGVLAGICVFPISVVVTSRLVDGPPLAEPTIEAFSNKVAADEVAASPHRPTLGGPFRLIDAKSGQVVSDSEVFDGKWTLLYFGFSKCAEICHRNLAFLTNVLAAARLKYGAQQHNREPLNQLQGCFLSIDYIRDDPKTLHSFLSKYDPKICGLCGSKEQVETAARAWRVYFSSYDESEEEKAAREAKGIPLPVINDTYQFDHSSAIYLVGPDGKLKDFFFLELGVGTLVDRLGLHFANAYNIND